MNENEDIELLDLEIELSALRPVAVESGLLARIDASLPYSEKVKIGAEAETRSNVIQGFFTRYGQQAAAALLVLSSGLLFLVNDVDESNTAGVDARLAGNSSIDPATIASGPGFQSVGTSSRVTAHGDSRVVIEEGKPFRVLEYDFQEEQRWTNPAEGTDVKVRQPRKEQMLIPLRVF